MLLPGKPDAYRGPMKVTPISSRALTNLLFSDRNPYPTR